MAFEKHFSCQNKKGMINQLPQFFNLLFGCPTANFGPLSTGHPLSLGINHYVFSNFQPKVTESLAMRLGVPKLSEMPSGV